MKIAFIDGACPPPGRPRRRVQDATRRRALVAAVVSAAACAALAQAPAPGPTPAGTRQGGPAVSLALTEEAVVAAALQRHPELQALGQRADAARLRAESASHLAAPVVKLGSIDSLADASNGLVQRRATAAVVWSPPRSGELDAKRALQGADAEASRYQADARRNALATLVRSTWRRLLVLRDQMALAGEAVKVSRRLAQLEAKAPPRGGADGGPLDERSLQYLTRLEVLREEWIEQLARLSDWLKEPEWREKAPQELTFERDGLEWVEALMREPLPSLAERRAQAAAQRAEVKEAAARCRTVEADAQIKETQGRAGLRDVELSYSSATDTRRPVVGVQVSITLPMGMSPHGSPAALAAQRRACESDRTALQSTLDQEISQHQVKLTRAVREAKPSIDTAVPIQEQALANMRGLYEEGRVPERVLRNVELRRAHHRLIALERASGVLQADATMLGAVGGAATKP